MDKLLWLHHPLIKQLYTIGVVSQMGQGDYPRMTHKGGEQLMR